MKRDTEIQQKIESIETPAATNEFFERLDERLKSEPLPGRAVIITRRRVVGTAVTTVAAALALVVAVNNQKPESHSPQIATPTTTAPIPVQPTVTQLQPLLAADVIARANDALSSVESISGRIDFVLHDIDYPSGTLPGSRNISEFGIRSNGDYFRRSNGESSSYIASTGRLESCLGMCDVSNGLVASDVRAQISFGIPKVIEIVRMADADDAQLQDATIDGRDTWLVTTSYPDNLRAGPSGSTPTITASIHIDKETSFPLKVSTKWNGQPETDITISDLKINPVLTDEEFDVLGGRTADFVDPGLYKRTTIERIGSQVGFTPPRPSRMPDGFELAEVSYIDEPPYEDAASRDLLRNTAVMTYRRGLESFSVEIRRRTAGFDYTEAFGANNSEVPIERERRVLTSGSFAGVNSYLETTDSTTQVWGIGSSQVFFVSGGLSRDELFEIAQSL